MKPRIFFDRNLFSDEKPWCIKIRNKTFGCFSSPQDVMQWLRLNKIRAI